MATDEKRQDADGTESEPDIDPGINSTDSRRTRILEACEKKDIDELRIIAITSSGFLSDDLRSKACK
jgi:TBC1 domain family member 20